jgi:hypothetical protein
MIIFIGYWGTIKKNGKREKKKKSGPNFAYLKGIFTHTKILPVEDRDCKFPTHTK